MAFLCFFFFKQKTAYEMRISDWSSDVCSSDLAIDHGDEATVRSMLVPVSQAAFEGKVRGRLAGAGGVAPVVVGTKQTSALPIVGLLSALLLVGEIGSASCRERVCQYV